MEALKLLCRLQAVYALLATWMGRSNAAMIPHTLNTKTANPMGLPSDAWRPIRLNQCLPFMARDSAPCLNYPNLVYAEEVSYSPFKIRFPKFPNSSVGQRMFSMLLVRHFAKDGWSYYTDVRGFNLIFENVTYNMNPPIGWEAGACFFVGATHAPFVKTEAAANSGTLAPPEFDNVMFVAPPDGGFFQHWDRVNLMLVQTEHLRKKARFKYIAHPPRDSAVSQFWRFNVPDMGGDDLIAPRPLTARRLLTACEMPLIHPYNTKRAVEILMHGAGVDPAGAPLEDRKVVLMLRRRAGSRNGGRRWLNYEECEGKVQQLLTERGQGERIELWSPHRFQSISEVMKYWSTEVRAAVGVHGGAFMNVWWAAPNTSIYEIWPLDHTNVSKAGAMYWENSSLKDLTYWALPGQSQNSELDVNVDCDALVEALKEDLGKPSRQVLLPWEGHTGRRWETTWTK